MKARRLKDNEIVDVIRYEKPINRDEVYVDGKLRLYLPSDLDFDVEEAEQTESAVISGWVARDKFEDTNLGSLFIYPTKPIRKKDGWFALPQDCENNAAMRINSALLPEVTWKNSPIEVDITIKAKKK